MRAALSMIATALLAAAAAQAAPSGDPAMGARVFLQCQACHARRPGGAALVGPPLAGIVGRRAASLPGYAYSRALRASGLVWTPDRLDAWLTDPEALVPQTRMAFLGIAAPRLRADVIAYLATLH